MTSVEYKASVTRMIPVETMVIPDDMVDLPVDELKQFLPERTDRANDITEAQFRKQQELQTEANDDSSTAEL